MLAAEVASPLPRPSSKEGLNFHRRLTDVELQDLALDLDGPDKDPDLLGGKLLWVGAGERFQVVRHGGMLVGRGLQTEPHLPPHVGQGAVVRQLVVVFRRVRKQQTKPSHIAGIGTRLKTFDPAGKFLAIHHRLAPEVPLRCVVKWLCESGEVPASVRTWRISKIAPRENSRLFGQPTRKL